MPVKPAGRSIILTIEHSPDEGMLPHICPDTGRRLEEVISDLQSLLEERGIALSFSETVAAPAVPGRFHRLLIDGRPLEDFVPPRKPLRPCAECPCSCDASPESGKCGSGGDGAYWDDFPESVVRLAVLKAAGVKH
ncbi:MAG: hypothetical protein QCH35_02825 [Methanomicrobiaceae archaeon]|nr:hypothetical protein [Methanomicrobiaceae archaeon]